MIVNVTSEQMETAPVIRQHVADRLVKPEKWQTHLIDPYIILSKEPQGFVADAIINTPNGVLAASGRHEDIHTVINELINKLERQLSKLRHKGETRRAIASVKDTNFVEEVEKKQSFILSVLPTRLRAHLLLTVREQYGHYTKVT